MEAVVISDLHVHNYKAFDINGSRLQNGLRLIDETYELCSARGINIVFMPGDLYDQQKALPTQVLNGVIDRFTKWTKEMPSVIWYMITGNHDFATKNLNGRYGVSALEHLQQVFPDNIILLDNSYEPLNRQVSVFGIPYYEYPEHYSEMLDKMVDVVVDLTEHGSTSKKILMIHQTPSGTGNPMIPVDTQVDDERYKNFDLVLCGHIHQRMQLFNNFWLVGPPSHRDLGDEGKDTGVLIVDLENPSKVTFVSWAGKFPSFKTVMEGEPLPVDGYAVVRPVVVKVEGEALNAVQIFSNDLKPEQLVENYWNQVDGQDKEILATGLSLLQ